MKDYNTIALQSFLFYNEYKLRKGVIMQGVFLDASILRNNEIEEVVKFNIQHNNIRFEFPEGFTQLRLIEECRALNCLDIEDPDNFDMIYDITMQMLVGKPVFIYFIDEKEVKHEIERFVVTDRYMNLRGIALIDEYPILVNWLVEFVAGYLGKKYPRSLKDIQAKMSEREELTKKSLNEQVEVRTSFQGKQKVQLRKHLSREALYLLTTDTQISFIKNLKNGKICLNTWNIILLMLK